VQGQRVVLAWGIIECLVECLEGNAAHFCLWSKLALLMFDLFQQSERNWSAMAIATRPTYPRCIPSAGRAHACPSTQAQPHAYTVKDTHWRSIAYTRDLIPKGYYLGITCCSRCSAAHPPSTSTMLSGFPLAARCCVRSCSSRSKSKPWPVTAFPFNATGSYLCDKDWKSWCVRKRKKKRNPNGKTQCLSLAP